MGVLPSAPTEEECRDACCGFCGSLFRGTEGHSLKIAGRGPVEEFPPGYDFAEADRLIGGA